MVLETEVDNIAALTLYESLYFLRDKRLHRFYLNGMYDFPFANTDRSETDCFDWTSGKDAYRLIYPVPLPDQQRAVAALHASGAQDTQAPAASARA